jgi:hypothetical protein
VDCADFDCCGAEACADDPRELSDAECSDGVDQDDNGFTDCEDFSCQLAPCVTVCDLE